MKTTYLHFSELLYNRITNGRDRNRVLAIAAGMAAARAVSIPSAPVENVQQYYNLSTMPLVQTLIEETNENLVMDFEEGMSYTLMFWRLRYVAAHPNVRLNQPSQYGFFDTILGANLYVDNDTHTFVNQYKKEIFELHDMLVEVYQESMASA
jgi:hypothetical protein